MSKVALPEGYKPSEKEEYMCLEHLEYFKLRLIGLKNTLLDGSRETLTQLKEENHNEPDFIDQASIEDTRRIELRTRNRDLKYLASINSSILKIDKREYGFCENTGEPIGLKRLEARPTATLCIEEQEKYENYEKQHLDNDQKY